MHFTSVANTTLHYKDEGLPSSLALVFINSLGSDLRIWQQMIPHLANSFRLIRYDKRGHGLSDCPSGPYTIHDHANDLAGLLDHLAIKEMILVGISVGGMIALDYAFNYPQQVAALVLCDTGAKLGTQNYWQERINAIRAEGIEPLAETILARWFKPDFAVQHPADYRGYRNMLIRTPTEGYAATCEAIRDADLRTVIPTIKTKTLVVCGAHDLATPPDLGRELAASLPNAEFVLIEAAAHLPCIEQPLVLATEIANFITE